ncbi:MAG TPA: GNAT family N-acetyltransferase [Polyangiaceae bacterium]
MDKTWTVRRATPSDAAIVAFHRYFGEAAEDALAAYAAWVKPMIGSGEYVGLLAIDDGPVVGGSGAVLLNWGPTKQSSVAQLARITNVYTAESHRKLGIAKALTAAVIEQCEQLGVKEFRLGSTDSGRRLYESLGFKEYPVEMRRMA